MLTINIEGPGRRSVTRLRSEEIQAVRLLEDADGAFLTVYLRGEGQATFHNLEPRSARRVCAKIEEAMSR